MPKLSLEPAALAGVRLERATLATVDLREPEAEPDIDPESDSARELALLEDSFKGRALREQARFDLVTDSEYWCCLCFQTREQVEAFLAATGWAPREEKYIDGVAVAKALGVAIPGSPPIPKTRGISKKLARLAS